MGSGERAARNGRVIVVLNGMTIDARAREEGERLLDWAFREFENVTLFTAGDTVENAKVWLGDRPTVPLVGGRDLVLTMPRNWRQNAKVDGELRFADPGAGRQGASVVGKLTVAGQGVPTMEVPLLAGTDVPRARPAGPRARGAVALRHGKLTGLAGAFITLEGGEGAGKSTQARLLAAALAEAGRPVLRTREPGGAPGAEALRDLLLAGAIAWSPAGRDASAFRRPGRACWRAASCPALEAGMWVVCDRFADSTMAYQGYGLGGDRAAIAALTALIGLLPDLTIVLDLPQVSRRNRPDRAAAATGPTATSGWRPASTPGSAAGFRAIAAAEPARLRRRRRGRQRGGGRMSRIWARWSAERLRMSAPEPRDNPDLFGHEAAEAALPRPRRRGRLHHAWLITGPAGVGKATLAYPLRAPAAGAGRATRDLTSSRQTRCSGASPPATHADLLTVERGVGRQAQAACGREIVVDDARDDRRTSCASPRPRAAGGWWWWTAPST